MPFSNQDGNTYRQYQNGRLIHGDCINAMQCMPSRSVDLIVTDPPYLVDYQSRDGRSIMNDVQDDWLMPTFQEAFRLLKNDAFCVSFYGWSKCDRFMHAWREAGFKIVGHLTFVKDYSSNAGFLSYQHEGAFLLIKGEPAQPAEPIGDVIQFPYSGNKLHPTQKPVEPLRQLIRAFSQKGDTVLDPFAGSGSTAVAAMVEGREFLTMEQMPEYFEIAAQRLEQLQQKLQEQYKKPVLRLVKETA